MRKESPELKVVSEFVVERASNSIERFANSWQAREEFSRVIELISSVISESVKAYRSMVTDPSCARGLHLVSLPRISLKIEALPEIDVDVFGVDRAWGRGIPSVQEGDGPPCVPVMRIAT